MAFALRPFPFRHLLEMQEPVVDLLLPLDRVPSGEPFCLGAYTASGDLAGYGLAADSAPGPLAVYVQVSAPYRGQGAGRALYDKLQEDARTRGATRLLSFVRENQPESLAFAERRGFRQMQRRPEVALSLASWDPTPFRGAVDDLRAAGIRFTTLADEGRNLDRVANLRRYYDFIAPLNQGVPGNAAMTWEQFRDWALNNPNWKEELILLAALGDRWIALAQLNPLPSGAFYHGFTAVDPAFRGRGLGLAVKVKALDLARAAGATFARTDTAVPAMVAVN